MEIQRVGGKRGHGGGDVAAWKTGNPAKALRRGIGFRPQHPPVIFFHRHFSVPRNGRAKVPGDGDGAAETGGKVLETDAERGRLVLGEPRPQKDAIPPGLIPVSQAASREGSLDHIGHRGGIHLLDAFQPQEFLLVCQDGFLPLVYLGNHNLQHRHQLRQGMVAAVIPS